MHIICTVTNDLNYDQRMQRICRSLTAHGYSVLLVGRRFAHSRPLTDQSFSQKRLQCLVNDGKLFYIEYNLRLLLFLLFKRFDIVNAVDLDTIASCWLASVLKRKKRVFDAHEYFPEVPEVVDRPQVQRIWRWVERTFVPRYPYAYTVSASLTELFNRQYGQRFITIRNVPELQEHAQPESEQAPFLLYQGALNQGRGLEQLLEAMQWIDCELKIAGEGDLSSELRQKAEALVLTNRVTFLGYLRPAELTTLTQQAHIGLNLLENSCLSYYYSLANKFFDYIHAGVPSINMAFPEYEQINREYKVAVLLNELSPASIADAVNNLLDNKTDYQRLKANCKKARKVYNWQQEEHKLLTLYDNLNG
jgi:glycosyltransferase involved in cell wall biosynthesis